MTSVAENEEPRPGPSAVVPAPEREHEPSLSEKLVHWLIFGVVVSLVPFLLAGLYEVDRNIRPSMALLFGRGELLIVAVIIAASGMGELFLSNKSPKRRVPKLVVIGLSVIVVIGTSFWFADVSALVASNHSPNPQTIADGSLISFGITIVTGFSALLLAKG